MRHLCHTPEKQRGAVMVLVVAGLVAIIAMAGLTLDMAHAYLNKTRLQNALDAAALSAATILNDGADVPTAEAAGRDTFAEYLEGELGTANPTLTFEFSETLVPFSPGAVEPDARYVRARVDVFPMDVWFARILPGIGDSQTVGGTAVSGPSPPLGTGEEGEICDIAPMMVCGDPSDTDCSDGECYGYTINEEKETVLKTNAEGSDEWEVGPGNFQLIELDCGPGGACVRDELSGGYSGCIDSDTVTTKPGNTVGPVAQGFNTRFGDYQGGMSSAEAPPDVVTDEGMWYGGPDGYQHRTEYGPHDELWVEEGGIGVKHRRVLAIVFGDCSTTVNGQGEVPVLGLGCFFMTQKTSHSGNTQSVYGQFISECDADGTIEEIPPGPGTGPALYKIILYKDPDSVDS
ncbi:MAG: Tad domain-containing protein [Gammaproteobacteria bacterium]|jgi:hypothetical protein